MAATCSDKPEATSAERARGAEWGGAGGAGAGGRRHPPRSGRPQGRDKLRGFRYIHSISHVLALFSVIFTHFIMYVQCVLINDSDVDPQSSNVDPDPTF